VSIKTRHWSPEPNHAVHTHLPKFYDKLKYLSTYALVFQVILLFSVSEEMFVNIYPL